MNAPDPVAAPPPGATGPRKGTLAALVGTIAAGVLLQIIPADESGRKVDVTIAPDGTATVKHVSGRQYLNAYLDIAGVATACDGITRGVKMGQRYTEAQCAAMLERELVVHASEVMACTPGLRQPGRDWVRIAAVSHGYQFGTAAWCGSSARRLIDAGKIVAACDTLPLWSKVRINGRLQTIPSIERRSQRRKEYCLTGQIGFPASTLPARLARWK